MTLRIVFAGTPEFAQTALAAIDAAGFPVELVLTQPDRPAGRGMKLQASPVKRYAQAHGMPVSQPPSLRRNGKYPEEAAAAIEQLRALAPDVMVVAAYGLILPQEVLDLPRYGCLNIHGSLLPRWRGAAPIHRAIEAGDAQTGITIMQMDAGLDTGAMLLREAEPIGPDDTTATLHDRMAALGGRMIVDALQRLARDGKLPGEAQPEAGVTYAEKIAKHEAVLDWRKPAEVLARQVRAFDPFPGALGTVHDTAVKLWRASAVAAPAGAAPGTVLEVSADAIVIACGNGALRVTECQKPGGKRLPVREFLAGFALTSGDVFAAAPPQAT
ncbi:methionyl-tRNA formyltransferase [Pandoraea pnomenusa]|uniref:Methionyl-tRNA formyltransferase n=1 Tax=Pandoraea pnomenusa TaxID=93220 RepID=A0A378YRG1_9BURK|nr:methionyl-tRNA formyltransferase [Pandoraea pnomenusa]AHN75716.1 methionyl-tRNA formyltransferase [Pandoraea pnomenusa]AIU27686.1 methionyl-tRNA formyltransferase [Pandoraea pnomenusa]QDX19828.1 methionyl-tRNA formyltransferase [Pandoraea pnomenusa]SUA78979.1 Methionyl-tRNA formyltransferase [Pandoraea pnomenusa]VVE71631.1 methionyl-tRNA formyltransferase [Pandoraea pnomenusa]